MGSALVLSVYGRRVSRHTRRARLQFNKSTGASITCVCVTVCVCVFTLVYVCASAAAPESCALPQYHHRSNERYARPTLFYRRRRVRSPPLFIIVIIIKNYCNIVDYAYAVRVFNSDIEIRFSKKKKIYKKGRILVFPLTERLLLFLDTQFVRYINILL